MRRHCAAADWLVCRRFGQLKLFIGSVVLFALTSFLCGFAHSMSELIIFRALQGFFAGPMFPMCRRFAAGYLPSSKRSVALALLLDGDGLVA